MNRGKHLSCMTGFNLEKKRGSLEPRTHAPKAWILNTLCLGNCGHGPRLDPTTGRHKKSGPLTVSTTPLNLAFRGSQFFPTSPCPVPIMTSTRSLNLNFCPLCSANNSAPQLDNFAHGVSRRDRGIQAVGKREEGGGDVASSSSYTTRKWHKHTRKPLNNT